MRNDRHRQGGWVGLVALLLALVLVGFLMRTVLKQMGFSDRPETPVVTKVPDEPGSSNGEATADTAVGHVATPLDRARDVEKQVLQQAKDAEQRIDNAAK